LSIAHTKDANILMNEMKAQKKWFDVVDLDPYGSAIPFLESALGCIQSGGLLALTFTDMAVLCARRPHVCSYKYGSVPLPQKYCHEMALRMILNMVSSMAGRHGRVIEPLLCLTVDFYVRLFIRVKDSPSGCHRNILKQSQVYQCIDCESFYLQPLGRELVDKKKAKSAVDNKKYKKQKEDKDKVESD
jgi:tRNA (guanine26-N2/guanine27-N2)-dimethyltransferase